MRQARRTASGLSPFSGRAALAVQEHSHLRGYWTAIESAPDSGRDAAMSNAALVEIHEYATHQEALEAVGLFD